MEIKSLQAILDDMYEKSKDQIFKNCKIYESKHYPHYAQDISEAWKVVEKMGKDKYLYLIKKYDDHVVEVTWSKYMAFRIEAEGWKNFSYASKDVKVAICLAALKAKGLDIELNLEKENKQ